MNDFTKEELEDILTSADMILKNERIEEIETIAWDLVLETYTDGKVIPPIDVMKIAQNLGVTVKFGAFSDAGVDGAFLRKEQTIYVNSDSIYTRQAFTLSHELGHYLLHKDKDQEKFYRRDMFKLDDDQIEREANWFAAALLMPRKLISHYCNIFNTVDEISKVFMVSYSAAYWRLKNLGYINA